MRTIRTNKVIWSGHLAIRNKKSPKTLFIKDTDRGLVYGLFAEAKICKLDVAGGVQQDVLGL